MPVFMRFAAAAFFALLGGPLRAETITVFAASSMANALSQIAPDFEAATGHDLVVSYAGSSALARQIQQGAPADIFISASHDWMDVLARDGLIDTASRFDLLANELVLVAHGAAPPVTIGPDLDLVGLLGSGRLAMALVDAVPAGIYGKAALEHLGLWSSVAPQVAQADNVRAALAFVANGAAPYGIVYASDAAAQDNVSIIGTFPAQTHPQIIYPIARLVRSKAAGADAFLTHLRSADARAVFLQQGFIPLAPAP